MSLFSPAIRSMVIVLGVLAGCGPSTEPSEPECGTEDVLADAALVIGIDGASCDPCRTDAELVVETVLSTDCGPVEWTLPSTCLVSSVRVTKLDDGSMHTLDMRLCGSAFRDWSVTPDEPLVIREVAVAEVFGVDPVLPGIYSFEVVFPANLSIEPAVFEVTLEER